MWRPMSTAKTVLLLANPGLLIDKAMYFASQDESHRNRIGEGIPEVAARRSLEFPHSPEG